MIANQTPKELSRQALQNIVNKPATWNQSMFHSITWYPECQTAHCYAGHIDLILGFDNVWVVDPNLEKQGDFFSTCTLKFDIKEVLGLSDHQWLLISLSSNTLDELVQYHNEFFKDDLDLIEHKGKYLLLQNGCELIAVGPKR